LTCAEEDTEFDVVLLFPDLFLRIITMITAAQEINPKTDPVAIAAAFPDVGSPEGGIGPFES
jgi:hypothetical protein